MKNKILITGSAGFIGFSLSLKLLKKGYKITGIDNHNHYYDQKLKKKRVKLLMEYSKYSHFKCDISNNKHLNRIFKKTKPLIVINLAAQAGVRYSIENPNSYIDSNITGFINILENCKQNKIKHLVYASTSSVYGANTRIPFSEHHSAEHPLSIYAATKKSNELMAHCYSYLYNLPTTGLRFFTVYGPWGRPDMALFKFTKNILNNKLIEVYNYGKHSRDFTYIDDIVDGIIKILPKPAKTNRSWDSNNPDPASSKVPWRIYNIGCNKQIKLIRYIRAIENVVGKKAKIKFLPLQQGDIPDTLANINEITKKFKYKPKVSVEKGVLNFVKWFKEYYKV